MILQRDRNSFRYSFGRVTYDLAERTYIMGVLNVTPDSFSDGGKYLDIGSAIARGLEMIEQGADFIDVGGESTRPKSNAYGEGSDVVPEEEEIRRVVPVIEALVRETTVPISIDTYKSRVAERAIEAGATIVNDISGFKFDREMSAVVGRYGVSAVLMHIKGTPKTMQVDPTYGDLMAEVSEYLANGITDARLNNISQVMIDPGIGFGKTQQHNLQLIRELANFKSLGYPILVGPSRKSFIGNILNLPTDDRLEGTLASVVACVMNGANIVRVHDVKETKRATAVADAIIRSGNNLA